MTWTAPSPGKESAHVRLPWSRLTDVDGPREKGCVVNMLLWVRMKWLKFQQERIEREISRKCLTGLIQRHGPYTINSLRSLKKKNRTREVRPSHRLRGSRRGLRIVFGFRGLVIRLQRGEARREGVYGCSCGRDRPYAASPLVKKSICTSLLVARYRWRYSSYRVCKEQIWQKLRRNPRL